MRLIRLIALCVAAVFLLSGCFYTKIFDTLMEAKEYGVSPSGIEGMPYTRPDVDILLLAGETVTKAAEADTDFDTLLDAVWTFEDLCIDYITNYNLSDILYSMDLTDTYWEEEYNFCMDNVPKVEQAQEQVYRALARSQHRDALEADDYFGAGFFEAYDGELLYDDHFLSLLEAEASLQAQYYDLCEEADPADSSYYRVYAPKMAQLYVDMVALRQEIAAYAGYPSFAHYAYETYYGRDYTPEESEIYLEAMGEALVPVFYSLCAADDWGFSYGYCTESTTFSYVRRAATAMGGTVSDAFEQMDQYKLYDISYRPNKYEASFEIFLPSYSVPFIFVNPSLDIRDPLTFAHEFGHFANDYACSGSYCGIDVAEVHSQAFEYLSLCYGENTEELTNYKMVDSLSSYIQCAAHALFELEVYQLTGDDLTVENVLKIQESVGSRFAFDMLAWDSWDFVGITHFYTNPMYMISYVVSNDLAMQIYQRELEVPGDGLALYENILYANESRILTFAQEYGLDSPFTPGRPKALAMFFREAFGAKLSGNISAA